MADFLPWPRADKPRSASSEASASGMSVSGLETCQRRESKDSGHSYPYVIFVATPSLEIVSISENVKDLLGFSKDSLIGRPQFWEERVWIEDWPLFQNKLWEMQHSRAVSFIHRIRDAVGLPVWLTNSLLRIDREGQILVHGCFVPVERGSRILSLDQETVGQFIHKLGNHFQLLNLVINTLKNSAPKLHETDVLQDTLDTAIDLTRIFSDCNQTPALAPRVQLQEVMKAAAESRVSQFTATGVQFQIDLEQIPPEATLVADPYLLEAALGHILHNAWEAIGKHGKIEIGAHLITKGERDASRIYIRDNGCGISAGELEQVTRPFFSTKKGHEGLGLTMAQRFIELHGGSLRIKSENQSGTEVEILLPME